MSDDKPSKLQIYRWYFRGKRAYRGNFKNHYEVAAEWYRVIKTRNTSSGCAICAAKACRKTTIRPTPGSGKRVTTGIPMGNISPTTCSEFMK